MWDPEGRREEEEEERRRGGGKGDYREMSLTLWVR
jgi:hypothetical protein